MIIRNAIDADVPAINSLIVQLGYPGSPDSVKKKVNSLASPDYRILVCETDGVAVAFVSMHCFDMFYTDEKMGRITALCVDEKVRDQGIGGLLLKAAEQYFSMQGCDQVEVTTNIKRLLTPEFYLKHGYAENSRRFVKRV